MPAILSLTPGTGAAAVSVWVADSLRKILPYDAPSSSTTIQLYCAKNEFESFQLVVSGAADNINDITLATDNLTSSSATLSSGNYSLFREHYMYIRRASDTQSIGTYGGSPVFVPDALVPYDRRVPPTYDPQSPSSIVLNLSSVYNKVLWVDLFVPAAAQAGDYSGNVTVAAGGARYTVRVNLHVWDFAIPSNNSYKISFNFSSWTAAQGHNPGSSAQDALSEEYAKVALANRLSFNAGEIVIPPSTYNDGGTPYNGTAASLRDDSITLDWSEYDAVVGPMLDGTITPYGRSFETVSIAIPYNVTGNGVSIYSAAPLTADVEMKLVLYWREFARHFRQKGWFNKLYFYNYDEPDPSIYDSKDLYLSKLLFYADPDIPVMVTSHYAAGLDKYVTLDPTDPKFNTAPNFYQSKYDPAQNSYTKPGVDIWDPVNRDYDFNLTTRDFITNPPIYKAQQAKGRHVWWYISCVSWNCQASNIDVANDFDIATLAIDARSVYVRHVPWLARLYGIEGLLYWSSVGAYLRAATINPWIDQFDVSTGSGGNGDGTLFYPGRPDVIGGTTDIAVATIRMKALRDGLEDFEYCKLLDTMGQSDYVTASLASVVTNTQNWAHDSGKYFDLRKQFGDKIAAAGVSSSTTTATGTSAPAVPTNLDATIATVDSITLTWVDNAADKTGYILERKMSGGSFAPIATLNANTLTYTDTGLSHGIPYTYRIKAVNNTVMSNYSNEKTVATAETAGSIIYGDVLNRISPGQALVLGSRERKGVINPDKGDTAQIYFRGNRQGEYRCQIFSLAGELLWQSAQQDVQEGMFEWVPGNAASGVYVAHLSGPGMNVNRKVAVIK